MHWPKLSDAPRTNPSERRYLTGCSLAGEPQTLWLTVGSLLAVRWLMRHRPTGDCWQEPTKALWLLAKFLKKVNDFNGLLAWHSRGRGFDSLQLHHEACQGVTEKSVTPFSLPKRQRAPTLGFGGYVRGQHQFPAHVLDREIIPGSLEFFSRGRPPSVSFAPAKNNSPILRIVA